MLPFLQHLNTWVIRNENNDLASPTPRLNCQNAGQRDIYRRTRRKDDSEGDDNGGSNSRLTVSCSLQSKFKINFRD